MLYDMLYEIVYDMLYDMPPHLYSAGSHAMALEAFIIGVDVCVHLSVFLALATPIFMIEFVLTRPMSAIR